MTNKLTQKPMRTVWHSLLWKEWHEHKWKLLALTLAILVLPLIIGSVDSFNPDSFLLSVDATLLGYGILAGLFVGMGTAAGENQRNTMPFMQSLPVAMPKPAAIKLLLSLVTVIVPVLLVVGATYGYLSVLGLDEGVLGDAIDESYLSGPFGNWAEMSLREWAASISLTASVFVASILLWMAAVSVNRSDEIRAGAIGFLVITIFWGILMMTSEWAEHNSPSLEEFLSLPMAMGAGAPGHLAKFTREFGMPLALLIISTCVGHGYLLTRYLRGFDSTAVRPARTLGGQASVATNNQWLGPPRRSQLTAIIWKQVHETGPLALIAATVVVMMACLAYWANSENKFRNSFGEILGEMTLVAVFLVTVVAGMGVFLEDVKPKIGTFWRSRPINTTTWFFVKFFTGLFVLLVTFGTLLLFAIAFPGNAALLDPNHPYLQVALFAAVFLLLYTLSMVSYCLCRHPIFAAVLALGLFYCGGFAIVYVLERWLPTDPHWTIPAGILALTQLVATAIAWLTVRNNWGWHK